MKSIIALLLVVLIGSPFVVSGIIQVPVCHKTGAEDNPYNLVIVSVHSVDDARGLNGHGYHEDDAWRVFKFNGVAYPGQNEYLFGTVIDDNCNLITAGTPTPTDTPTATPTECCCPTPTPTPEPNNILYFPIMQKAESVCYPYCAAK